MTTRRAGRPNTPVLSRELILQTALRLLTERGEAGAGIRDIARELGVRPSALYNHVRGQDDLIAGVRELVSDRIDVSGFGDVAWDAALERWARSYREAFAAHPPTIALLAVKPLAGAHRTLTMYDAVSRGLLDAGWPRERVLSVIVAFESFILGSALDRSAPADMLDPGVAVTTDDDVSAFRSVYDARARALDGAVPADDAFELGLDALLAGFRAEHAAL